MNTPRGDADRAAAGSFVWPPRATPADDAGPRAPVDGIPASVVGRLESRRTAHEPGAIESVERRLFGASSPSLRRAWRPEPAGDACPRCAGSVGTGEADADGCASCRGVGLRWDQAVRLGGYRGELRAAITACKYRGDRQSGARLGRLLGTRVRAVLDSHGLADSAPVVIPVPTTLRRRLANGGIDHALLLARGVSNEIGVELRSLLRRRASGRQTRVMSAAARARNVRGAFGPLTGRRPPETGVVVLVDDVRTTGATAAACFRALTALYTECVNARSGSARRPVFLLATAGVSERRRGRIGAHGAEDGVRGAPG